MYKPVTKNKKERKEEKTEWAGDKAAGPADAQSGGWRWC